MARSVDELLSAFALAIDDVGLARAAIERGLIRVQQRAGARDDRAGDDRASDDRAGDDWAVEVWAEAFRWTTENRWPRSVPAPIGPAAISKASADSGEIAELPFRQRSSLVGDLVLGWTDEQNATAHRTIVSTIDLRRRRALGELRRERAEDNDDALREGVAADLRSLLPAIAGLPDPSEISTAARRRTLRTRLLVAAGAAACIGLVGLALGSPPEAEDDELTIAGQVDPPSESQAPHAPITDGRGGFTAFARGSGHLSVSTDGETWTEQSRFNIGRIDLRLSAERFFRSDDRYVMLIDSSSSGSASLTDSDAPRIALSDDLLDWTVLRLDLDPLPAGSALLPEIDLLNAAVVGDTVLAAVRINQEINHRRLGVTRNQICTTTDDRDGLLLHLCDGTVVPVAEQGPTVSGTDRLFISRGGAAFEELETPEFFNPWGLVSYNGQFGMLEESSNRLHLSDDGTTWTPFFELGVDNRLGLIESQGNELLVIAPDRDGWTSNVIRGDTAVAGSLPLGIDPTTIWIKPQVASGPAGWAVYLTTSRPWDRRNDTVSGWALQVDDWLIEQRPERSSIRLRSTSTDLLYEYHGLIDSDGITLDHPSVERSQFGGVRLYHPETGELVVDVSGRRIRDAWVSGADADLDLSGRRSAPGQGSIEVDGWFIEGNIRTGPLSLRRAGGAAQVFDDGYAFTNGDRSDRVESTISSDPTNGRLTFFDQDGDILVEIDATTVLDALDPAPVEDEERARAMLLFSPDGVRWEQLWSTPRPTWYGSVAVGDDEVLLSTAAFGRGPERIPVDQSDS